MRFAPVILIGFLLFSIGPVHAWSESDIQNDLKEHAGGVCTLASGTYVITEQLVLPDNTILQGDIGMDGKLNTKFILSPGLTLGEQIPVIEAHSGDKIIGIDFDGNSQDRPTVPAAGHSSGGVKQWGGGYDNFIGFTSCDGIEVAYCNFYNNLGDGLRAVNSKNIEHNNTASKGGHDVFYAVRCEVVSAHDNYVQPRVNAAFRFMDVNQGQIYNNTINYVKTYDGVSYDAGPAIQIQHDSGTMKGVEVCGNTIYDSCGPAFWIVGKTSGGEEAYIHHNAIYNAGGNHGIFWVGGIIASGYDNLRIENNVFDTPFLGAVNFYAVQPGWATQADANLSKNIFVDAVPGTNSNYGGFGVYNAISEQTIGSIENCFFDNAAGNTYGCSVSSSDVFNDPRASDTPSDWSWNGQKWVCPGVPPSKLGSAGGVYENVTPITPEEENEFEFSNLFGLNAELSETGNIEQKTIADINPEWETQGKVQAYIYLSGYSGQIYIDNETYIPKSPAECAIVHTNTRSLEDKTARQESTVKLSNGENNSTLIVDLEVKTTYKVKTHTKILGINVPHYTEKSRNDSFSKVFPAPVIFPTFEAPKVYVTYYRGSHVVVYVPEAPGIVKTRVFLNNSSAREQRLIGRVGTALDGFRSTHFEKVESWAYSGSQMSRGVSGLHISEPFNVSDLRVEITTPYGMMQAKDIEYVVVEDNSLKMFNLGNLTMLILIFTYGRPIIIIFKREVFKWLGKF